MRYDYIKKYIVREQRRRKSFYKPHLMRIRDFVLLID